jgi:hypothetical protein
MPRPSASYCSEKFPNDPSIEDGAHLYRRIPPLHFYLDKNENRVRPSSAAFEDDDDSDPMSVCLSQVLQAENREPSSVLTGHPGYALAAITAGLARSYNQTVHPKPLPDESSHALVCGDKESGKKNAPKRKFALAAVWVVPPPEPATS